MINVSGSIGPFPANLYWISKNLAAEAMIDQMVCKIKPTDPVSGCPSGDLKVAEARHYINKQTNHVSTSDVTSWTSPCPHGSNYIIRVSLLCASTEDLLKDINN